jgi:hypothetical protein
MSFAAIKEMLIRLATDAHYELGKQYAEQFPDMAGTWSPKGHAYGSRVHTGLGERVKALDPETRLRSEISYRYTKEVPHGTPGSVRLDVVHGPPGKPTAIWDLKTGIGKLTPQRIAEIRRHLPAAYRDIPIEEFRLLLKEAVQ